MLRFEGIHFQYPGASQPALEGVTFAVPKGEALGLLGPNGAGKTTLISIATGLLAEQGGQITFGHETLAALRRHDPRRVALVPQDNAFYPMLTVRENLTFFARVQGIPLKEREAFVLTFTQLEAFVDRRADQLSGGLKRRLNLAIGLLADPEILLLDEPTVGVDPQSRHFLLEAIRNLQREGRTIIYTSHYMDEIEAICGHVAILDLGRVLVAGTLGDVLASAPPVCTLRTKQTLPAALAESWRHRFDCEALAGLRYRLPGVRMEEVNAVVTEARAAGVELDAWAWGQQHLDDVFMQLTHRNLRDE
ncbi:MAG: ABC transporter ATP-binding protein [Holophaga sp.]|nr:ABC transporter ATP-binding protein [Holophaga sp.]